MFLSSIAEPEDLDRKKKTLKSKIKGSKPSHTDSKPNISYPTNFEHTVHVGFDPITGEFTVSLVHCVWLLLWLEVFVSRAFFSSHMRTIGDEIPVWISHLNY